MSRLETIREATRSEVERAVAEALERRRTLEHELRQVDEEIAMGRAWLGDDAGEPAKAGPMSLHDAMELVLKAGGNAGMTPADLADTIAERGLYRMRDGRRADARGVQARVTNYKNRFVRDGGLVKLRD